LSKIDVVIGGSDLCGVAAAALFKKRGFSVLVVDGGRRLGGNHCYLPLTTHSIRLIDAALDGPYIVGMTRGLELILRGEERSIHKPLPIDVCLIDSSVICEYLAETNDLQVLLWSRITSTKTQGSILRTRLETPQGKRTIDASLFIDTRPRHGGASLSVMTCIPSPGIEKGYVSLSKGTLELSLRHGSLTTIISTDREIPARCRIASSEVRIGDTVERSPGILVAGEPAGHAASLWIGDALVSSSNIIHKVGSTYLEGIEDTNVLGSYLELQRISERGKIMLELAKAGGLDELPLSFVEKMLDPQIYRELLI